MLVAHVSGPLRLQPELYAKTDTQIGPTKIGRTKKIVGRYRKSSADCRPTCRHGVCEQDLQRHADLWVRLLSDDKLASVNGPLCVAYSDISAGTDWRHSSQHRQPIFNTDARVSGCFALLYIHAATQIQL